MKHLYRIFRLFKCPHKWETQNIIEVFDVSFGVQECPTYRNYISQCKRCGKIRKTRV